MTLAAAGSLDPQGPSAEAIARLWWLMLIVGAAVFALVAVLLVVGLLRRDRGQADPGAGNPIRTWVIGGGVVLPTVVLLLVFVATIVAMRALPASAPGDALRVEIVGHQWWYEVRYPEHGITTRDELRIPVGRPVALELTSADVIHSFWVPALGGKRDMLPDGTNLLVLEASQAGEHRAQCAEFCGLEHATMHLRVVAEPADRFAAWVAAQ